MCIRDRSPVVCHGDAHHQPVGLALAQAAQLGDARIGAVGAGQLGQPAAHAAQHQRVPGGMVVAAGGAAAEGGIGGKAVPCRGQQAAQPVKAGGLGKVLLEVALADLKAAQPVHRAVPPPQGQQKQLHLLRGAGPVSYTHLLYGEKDALTSMETIKAFAEKNNAELTVMPGGEHWFHTKEQMQFLDNWIKNRRPCNETENKDGFDSPAYSSGNRAGADGLRHQKSC